MEKYFRCDKCKKKFNPLINSRCPYCNKRVQPIYEIKNKEG